MDLVNSETWQWPQAGWIFKEEMLEIPAIEVSESQLLFDRPVVSVLMMACNHAEYLEDAVQSVMEQDFYLPIELLIGVDFSCDNTLQQALRLRQRCRQQIRVIYSKAKVGIRSNFLRLTVRARAPMLAFLEGDDYWTDPKKLVLQYTLLKKNPEQAVVAAATTNRMQWLSAKPSYKLQDLLRRYAVHTSSLVVRACHLSSYPRFPDNVCWESMLLGYLLSRGDCGYIPREMSYYRRHHGGLWHNADRLRRLEMSRECIDALDAYFFGRFRKELTDREFWIYAMDWQLPERQPWAHWRQSWGIIYKQAPRLLGRSPRSFLLLYLRTLFQPMSFAIRWLRSRLALGSRIKRLLGIALS